MSVVDEIIQICAQIERAGGVITYATVRAQRGRGSKRDIGEGIRVYHSQRAAEKLDALPSEKDPPDRVMHLGEEYAKRIFKSAVREMQAVIEDAKLDIALAERTAQEEISALQATINEQQETIEQLRTEIERLRGQSTD